MCTLWKVSKYGVFSGPYFPVFGLNTEIYEDRIQSEYGKIRSRKNSVFRHFSRSGVLCKPINFLDNIPKYSYIFSQLCLCRAKWTCFYCQVFQVWLLIQRVVGSVVSGSMGTWSVVGWSVGRWSVDLIKPRKKAWLGWWFCLCPLVEVYSVILTLIFSGCQKQSPESQTSPKDM